MSDRGGGRSVPPLDGQNSLYLSPGRWEGELLWDLWRLAPRWHLGSAGAMLSLGENMGAALSSRTWSLFSVPFFSLCHLSPQEQGSWPWFLAILLLPPAPMAPTVPGPWPCFLHSTFSPSLPAMVSLGPQSLPPQPALAALLT